MQIDILERNAPVVARILGSLANANRLMILCSLLEAGERNVGQLADALGLTQSAVSQHLARLREEGFVETRREAQTIWYRIGDRRVSALMATLHEHFCTN